MWSSNRRQLMYDSMPSYYREIKEIEALTDLQAADHDRIYADIQDVLAQFFVETATWGLAKWEQVFGLPTDESKPVAERRALIKARIRGVGTVTTELLENVAESWYSGNVDIIEKPAEYTIVVKFVSSVGVPSNLADVEKAIRELVPAHLVIEFAFTYLIIRDVQAMTLTELETKTLDQFAGR